MQKQSVQNVASAALAENGKSKKRPKNSSKSPTLGNKQGLKRQRSGLTTFKKGTLAYDIVCILEKHASNQANDGIKDGAEQLGLAVQDIVEEGFLMGLSHFLAKKNDLQTLKKQISQSLSKNRTAFVRQQRGMYSLAPGYSQDTLSNSTSKHGGNQRTVIRKKIAQIDKRIEILFRRIEDTQKELDCLNKDKKLLPKKKKGTGSSSLQNALRIDAVDLQQFELSDMDKQYSGNINDRKAMLEHRQIVQQRAKELEKAKDAFIKEHQEQILKERKKEASLHRNIEQRISKLEIDIDNALEKKKKLTVEREILTGRLGNLIEEKRVKKAGTNGKPPIQKYPMEDTKIHDPKPSTFEPEWIDTESAQRRIKLFTIADNLLLIGSRTLGTKAPTLHDLDMMLEEVKDKSIQNLGNLYYHLMELLVSAEGDEKECMSKKRWGLVMTDGCWPEILRRFVMMRDSGNSFYNYQRPDTHTSLAASILGSDPLELLSLDQHLSLLFYLTDTVLVETWQFRDALQRRELQSINLKRDIKELSKEGSKFEDKINEAERKLLFKPMRREPLGLDRKHRRYWWGLGGIKDEILVEDSNSDRIALITTEHGIESLISSLDTRGIREKSLYAAISTIKDTIILNMRKGNGSQSVEIIKKEIVPLRQSARQTRQVEFFDPSKPRFAERRERAPRKQASSIQYLDQLSILDLPLSTRTAYSDAIANLIDIKRTAIEAGIAGPLGDESWSAWTNMITQFGHQYGTAAYRQLRSEDIMGILRDHTFILEKVLNKKSMSLQGKDQNMNDNHPSSQGEENEDETEHQDEEESMSVIDDNDIGSNTSSFVVEYDILHDLGSSAPKRNPKQSIFLWQTLRERTLWISDLTCSQSPARIDYCIRVLRMQSKPLIRKLMADQ